MHTPDPLLPVSTSNLIQHGKNAHRLTGLHLTRRSVMNVIRESREIRKMRRVIPTRDQLIVGIGPVIAAGDHRDLTSGGALHLFGKLELVAISWLKRGAKVPIDQCRALTYHVEAGDDRTCRSTACGPSNSSTGL